MFTFPSLPSLADLFWAAATSSIVLIILAAVVVIARIAALIGAIPFVPVPAKFLVFARPVAALSLLLLVFLIGFRLSDERSSVKQVKSDLAFARWQIDSMQATADDADRLTDKAAGEVAALKQKASDYEDHRTPDRRCVFNRDDVGRLQPIR